MKTLIGIIALLVLGLAGSAQAQNAGTQCLVKSIGSTACASEIKHGDVAYYVITNSTGHSATFNVLSSYASFCPNDANFGVTVVKAHIVVSAATAAGSLVPSAETTSTLTAATNDCFDAIHGVWYLEVTTPVASGTTYVKVTGRDS